MMTETVTPRFDILGKHKAVEKEIQAAETTVHGTVYQLFLVRRSKSAVMPLNNLFSWRIDMPTG